MGTVKCVTCTCLTKRHFLQGFCTLPLMLMVLIWPPSGNACGGALMPGTHRRTGGHGDCVFH